MAFTRKIPSWMKHAFDKKERSEIEIEEEAVHAETKSEEEEVKDKPITKIKFKTKTKPHKIEPAHFFPFTQNTISPLYCHSDDCGMNVFKALNIILPKDALYIANTTDDLHTTEIKTFLSNKYGVAFHLDCIYEKKNGKTLIDKKNAFKTLYNIPEGYAVIIFLNTQYKLGHFAIMTKQKGIVYYVDPQSGNRQIQMVTQSFLKLMDKYESLYVFTSDGPRTQNNNHVSSLERDIAHRTSFDRTKKGLKSNQSRLNRLVHKKNNVNHVNNVNHYKNNSDNHLIKGNTYKIELYNQFLGIGEFDKYSPHKQATFKNFKFQPDYDINFIHLKNKTNSNTKKRKTI
jgi:hypothetical protein